MSKLDEMKDKLGAFGAELESLAKEIYDQGFIDGISTDRPSQRQFDEAHKTPRAYGEEADWLVLRGSIKYDTAERMFRAYMKKEYGWDDEEIGDTDDHLRRSNLSYQMYEGDMCYYLRADRGGIYDCWVWEREV